MTYVLIPILLTVVLIGYALYLLLIKKDKEKLKSLLFPGLMFIGIWVLIYFYLLK